MSAPRLDPTTLRWIADGREREAKRLHRIAVKWHNLGDLVSVDFGQRKIGELNEAADACVNLARSLRRRATREERR